MSKEGCEHSFRINHYHDELLFRVDCGNCGATNIVPVTTEDD